MTHTPGPWIYKGGETTTIREADGSMICQMKFLAGPHGLSGRRSNEEVDATARLIAAAPELYEALKEMIAAYDFCAADPADRGYSALDNAVGNARVVIAILSNEHQTEGN
jgi:hypothetical protein